MNTYDVDEAIQAQKEYCKEYAAKYPNYALESMKEGTGFAPSDGYCHYCWQQMYSAEGIEYRGSRKNPTGRKVSGISVEEARTKLTTGCPFCCRSFVD